MKVTTLVYKRDVYFSELSGTVIRYRPDAETYELLGQAKYLFVHARIYSLSGGTTPIVKYKFFHSAIEGQPPSVTGVALGAWDYTKNGPGSFIDKKDGGHAGFLEMVMEVVDSAATPTGQVKAELEVWVTTIVEE